MTRRFKVPARVGNRPGDYHRVCDRCSSAVWYRSELTREPQTKLLVCHSCLDKPVARLEPNRVKPYRGKTVID